MKWTQLVDRVVLQFGTNPHNKALARKFVEEAERDFAFHTRCLIRDKSIVVNEQDNFFELPNDFLELKSAILYDERTLQPYRNQVSRIKFDGTNVTGSPSYYILTSNQIILVPHPSDQGVVNFQYIAQPVATQKNRSYIKLNYKNLDNGFFQTGDTIKGVRSKASGVVHRDINDIKSGTLTLHNITEGSHVYTLVGGLTPQSTVLNFSFTSESEANFIPSSGTIALKSGGSTTNISYTGRVQTGSGQVRLTGASVPDVIGSGATATIKKSFIQNETIHTFDDDFQLAQVSGSYTFAELEAQWDEFGLSARATSSSVVVNWTDDDKDSPEIPDIYHLYLVDYAKSTLAENEKEFELADRFMMRYTRNREQVRSQISGKGTGAGLMTVADTSMRDALL